jgi:hypothetical protein
LGWDLGLVASVGEAEKLWMTNDRWVMRATRIGYMNENAARVALQGIAGKSRKRAMGSNGGLFSLALLKESNLQPTDPQSNTEDKWFQRVPSSADGRF